MVIEDWRPPIVEMVMVKRDLAGYDPQNAFPNHLPEVAAPPQKIDETEQSLAIVLDPEHRAFLSFADGWKCFHQHATLLSTSGLIAGPLRDAALDPDPSDGPQAERELVLRGGLTGHDGLLELFVV